MINIKRIFFSAVILLFPLLAQAHSNNYGCDIKKQHIYREMEFAKAYGNWHRVQGLQRALQRIERNCNNDSWIVSDSKKIEEKEFKVARYKAELEVAEKYNDVKEIQGDASN
ncbi:DUF1090 domain-containing protein [Escherichia coli]|nr:DUF1090 domain-containing protein [Escherichia coli]EHM3232171.1 DUF1090 domain-containing protein [Escherichia coli]MBS9324598.1 DUF1090 domain-containing protein [Escherichia coli]